jgi:hypothetical protein
MIQPMLKGMQQRRKFNRGRQRKPIRPLLGGRHALSLRRATRQSQRMHARRTGLRGL